jgi:hypothetical protein
MSESQRADEAAGTKSERSFSLRAERSLKDADRTLKMLPDQTPEHRVMVQLEQARVYALLQLADDIRESRLR